ncbi:MAG TPA: alkaline phosphatase family protein [Kofleriaceae bacterium]|nr:alkaline phosphatase family protein [Kofleriaceae bacterium]
MRRMISAGLLALCACGNTNAAGDDQSGDDDGMQPDAATPDTPTVAGRPTIFTIVLENKNDEAIYGSTNAPYLNSLIAMGALATNYKDTAHPSLPNYLHMISGANQYPGVVDVSPTQVPYFPADKPNLGTQLQAANLKWRSYQESMGTPCKLSNDGKYAPKHDPFLYFTDMQKGANGLCAATNVDYSLFEADLATNEYDYMWITPNLDNDGHDPASDPALGLRNSDMWMSHEVPKILASTGFKAGGILFITWDEDEGGNNEKIPMIIVSPRVKAAGMTSDTAYTHASYLATVEELLSLPRLDTVAQTPSMMEFLKP